MSSSLGYLGSLIRSLGQIKEIPCGHSRNHIYSQIDQKIGQKVSLDEMPDSFELGQLGS